VTGHVQVVAVLDHAGGQRMFAAALTAAFRHHGLELGLRTHRELVAEVSIEQPLGGRPSVEPDRVLLWLSAADPAGQQSPDGAFLGAEISAAARSIAMLTESPVLNRPTAVSSCGLFPASAVAAVRQAAHVPGLTQAVRAERFTAGVDDDQDGHGTDEIYDYSTGRSSFGIEPTTIGPVRRRRSAPTSRPVRVRVVGTNTITSAVTPPVVVEASLRVTAWYQLDLATVWWLVHQDDTATLARVDCWTWDRTSDRDLHDTAEATAAWISDRLSGLAGAQPTGPTHR
jgi:hypothetical protein